MNKQEFRKQVLLTYSASTGDYFSKDDYHYDVVISKVDKLFQQGLGVEESAHLLDEFISDM